MTKAASVTQLSTLNSQPPPLLSEFLQQLLNGLSLGAIYALIALGYKQVDAHKAVKQAAAKTPDANVESLVTASLKLLL